MNYIDLHVHSTASDGSYTPSELVRYATEKGLIAFALTDHDTTAGIDEALNEAALINSSSVKNVSVNTSCKSNSSNNIVTENSPANTTIKVIPGIELSAEYKGKDIHILGLNIDYRNKEFQEKIEYFRNIRAERNVKMIELLNKQGFKITEEQLKERFKDAVITRAHFAIMLVECGYVKDKDIAFKKYLNPGCPCYVPRTRINVIDAISLIHLANGKAVLAHPLLYHLSEAELDSLVALLKENGLQGVEAIYSSNKWNDESRMKQLAKKYDLFITGGSDFHGLAKPTLDLGVGYGDLKVPEELLSNILND